MQKADQISIYQSTFRPSEVTSHFDERRHGCKPNRLDIPDPKHVFLMTTTTADGENYNGESLRSYKDLGKVISFGYRQCALKLA